VRGSALDAYLSVVALDDHAAYIESDSHCSLRLDIFELVKALPDVLLLV
jgi:hypothetical protein